MKTIYTEFTNWELVGETEYNYIGSIREVQMLFSKSKENIEWSFNEEFPEAFKASKIKMNEEIDAIREKYNSTQII